MIVTAHHCTVFETQLTLVNSKAKVVVEASIFKQLHDLDFAYFEYSSVPMMSTLCLKMGKVGDRTDNTIASLVCENQATLGQVKTISELFGYVAYCGTTWPGCSGAPYHMGNAIFGMHLGGSNVVNFGLDASYLNCALQVEIPISNADHLEAQKESGRWVLHQLRKGKKPKWMRTGNPDIISVNVDNKYYLVDTMEPDGAEVYRMLRTGEYGEAGIHRECPIVYGHDDMVAGGQIKTALQLDVQPEVPAAPPTLDSKEDNVLRMLQNIMDRLQALETKETLGFRLSQPVEYHPPPTLSSPVATLPIPSTSGISTSTLPMNILDLDGQVLETKMSGSPSTSTKPSRPDKDRNPHNKSSKQHSPQPLTTMDPGDLRFLADLISLKPTKDILDLVSKKLSVTLTGKLQ